MRRLCSAPIRPEPTQGSSISRGANVLVMHLAIAAGVTSPLHAPPAVVGRIAQEAGVGRLIVSHIGQFDLDAAITDLKKFYADPLTWALTCNVRRCRKRGRRQVNTPTIRKAQCMIHRLRSDDAENTVDNILDWLTGSDRA